MAFSFSKTYEPGDIVIPNHTPNFSEFNPGNSRFHWASLVIIWQLLCGSSTGLVCLPVSRRNRSQRSASSIIYSQLRPLYIGRFPKPLSNKLFLEREMNAHLASCEPSPDFYCLPELLTATTCIL